MHIPLLVSLFLSVFLSTTLEAGSGYIPTDAERARWTMQDMRSWSIVLAAYQADYGKFPVASSLEALVPQIQPVYIRYAPVTDAWGNPYRVAVDANGQVTGVVSAGADGKFDEKSWTVSGEQESFEADAVATAAAGRMFRRWQYR